MLKHWNEGERMEAWKALAMLIIVVLMAGYLYWYVVPMNTTFVLAFLGFVGLFALALWAGITDNF